MALTRTKKESIQPAVKIDKLLNDELTEWLKTDYAKSLGFHSKAHFLTQSVRELMFKYRTQKFVNIEKRSDHFRMMDLFLGKHVTVEINKSEFALECQTCFSNKEYNCDHIYTIWLNPRYAGALVKLRFPSPFGGAAGLGVAPNMVIRK